jgi:hypothetical protein
MGISSALGMRLLQERVFHGDPSGKESNGEVKQGCLHNRGKLFTAMDGFSMNGGKITEGAAGFQAISARRKPAGKAGFFFAGQTDASELR